MYLNCQLTPQLSTTQFGSWSSQTWGEFKNASALERSLYWCQALHITNNDRYQINERSQALASGHALLTYGDRHTLLTAATDNGQNDRP